MAVFVSDKDSLFSDKAQLQDRLEKLACAMIDKGYGLVSSNQKRLYKYVMHRPVDSTLLLDYNEAKRTGDFSTDRFNILLGYLVNSAHRPNAADEEVSSDRAFLANGCLTGLEKLFVNLKSSSMHL